MTELREVQKGNKPPESGKKDQPVRVPNSLPTQPKARDMAYPIDYGQVGGQEGVIARIVAKLRAIAGETPVPEEQINDQTVAKAMELSRYDFQERTFTHADVVEWLHHDRSKATPAVYQRTGVVISNFVSSGAIEMLPPGPDDQAPKYRLINEEPIRKAAYPNPPQQARPVK